MKIFQSSMGKSKSLPKAKLYPCLLALCDEQITDLSMRVTMLANPDTACRVDVQGKGGNGSGGSSGGSGSGAVNGGGWKGKGRPEAHTTNQDGRSGGGGGAIRKGCDGTTPQNSSPKKCAFCSGFHPLMFYCEHLLKQESNKGFLGF